MTAFTTRQRDLLKVLLAADAPMGANDLAAKMQITPRQVNYGLKGVECWLKQRGVKLEVTPGLGVEVLCSAEQSNQLRQDLVSDERMQLVLSAEQRQQLLALVMLVADEPMILAGLKHLAQVSRSTVSKDLDSIEGWVEQYGMKLIRRPNFGIFMEGLENIRQELLFMLLWGESPFGKPLMEINHTDGLTFVLHQDANLLPLVKRCNEIIGRWNVRRIFGVIAYTETQFGGRFTDDAVLHLALVFAIQTDRVADGHSIQVKPEDISWMKSLLVWPVARKITQRLGWKMAPQDADVAGIAMHILASPRNERWPGDLEIDGGFEELISDVMAYIGGAYKLPDMIQDRTLHDGIVNQVVPACLRQRFQLWMPRSPQMAALSDRYVIELEVAQGVAQIIEDQTQIQLPEDEINNIAMLLRATYIRTRPYRFERVIVVCPSGMATAQLLVARLEARFPRLGPLDVISVRALNTKKLDSADLIISTVPLPSEIKVDVIQVHPLLLPEDVETITEFLT